MMFFMMMLLMMMIHMRRVCSACCLIATCRFTGWLACGGSGTMHAADVSESQLVPCGSEHLAAPQAPAVMSMLLANQLIAVVGNKVVCCDCRWKQGRYLGARLCCQRWM